MEKEQEERTRALIMETLRQEHSSRTDCSWKIAQRFIINTYSIVVPNYFISPRSSLVVCIHPILGIKTNLGIFLALIEI